MSCIVRSKIAGKDTEVPSESPVLPTRSVAVVLVAHCIHSRESYVAEMRPFQLDPSGFSV